MNTDLSFNRFHRKIYNLFIGICNSNIINVDMNRVKIPKWTTFFFFFIEFNLFILIADSACCEKYENVQSIVLPRNLEYLVIH